MDRKLHFERIESILIEVLTTAKTGMNDEDTAAVQEFIDVGEYGLAYERLIDSLPNETSPPVRDKLRFAGELMGYKE